MRQGWNPTRRNRKIGTKAQGYGLNNRLVIPSSWHSLQSYWEDLSSYVTVKRKMGDKEQVFIVEPTNKGWFYPCTVDDMAMLLQYCSPSDLESFDIIIMRQPTRKQKILSPVWGRAQFWTTISKHHEGSAIIIESLSLTPYTWRKSLDPEFEREFERLKGDGHHIEANRRHFTISPTATSARNTVLFRTLLHEIGHHIDYNRCSYEEWDGKTRQAKEDFAHRYAETQYQVLLGKSVVPFAPIIDPASLERDGLKLEWFISSDEYS